MLARLNAVIGITACTGFMCIQQFTKKGIVLNNFSSYLTNTNQTQQVNANQTPKKTKIFDKVKQKYRNSKQKVQQIKQKGNGSYYSGMKKMYQQKIQQSQKEVASTPQKSTWETIKQSYNKSKQTINQMKEDGQGSYYNGFKKYYKQYMSKKSPQVAPVPKQTTEALSYKQKITKKFNTIYELYKKASDGKNQKLAQNHLIFGSIAIGGSILMPRTYLLLCIAYFTAYQLYYFGEVLSRNKGYKSLQNINFVPIWQGFMIGSVLVFGGTLLKIYKALH